MIDGSISSTGHLDGAIGGTGLISGGVNAGGSGTSDYRNLIHKPIVNGETLIGEMDSEDLHIVACKTTAEWAQLTTLVSRKGEIYVYSDGGGENKPMLKIGDGNAYVVDLPFDTSIDARITDEDIANWNNKVSVRADGERLIFY